MWSKSQFWQRCMSPEYGDCRERDTAAATDRSLHWIAVIKELVSIFMHLCRSDMQVEADCNTRQVLDPQS